MAFGIWYVIDDNSLLVLEDYRQAVFYAHGHPKEGRGPEW